MVLIRIVFQTEFGKAGEFAQAMKQNMERAGEHLTITSSRI